MTRNLLALISALGLLLGTGCTGSLGVDTPDDDDNDASDDDAEDDDAEDDDAEDDDVSDDDVSDDDAEDDDVEDDDVSDDDSEPPCCTSLDYPAYAVDSIAITTFLPLDSYNEFLSELLADALPPDGDSVIIIFDPEQDPDGLTAFDARYGVGEVNQDLWDYDAAGSPVNWDFVHEGNGAFYTTDEGLTMTLSFGVTVPLYEAGIDGAFNGDYSEITSAAVRGAIMEEDTEDIETSFGNLHDLMVDRPLDVDVSGNGTEDAWSFVMEWTAFQFVP